MSKPVLVAFILCFFFLISAVEMGSLREGFFLLLAFISGIFVGASLRREDVKREHKIQDAPED